MLTPEVHLNINTLSIKILYNIICRYECIGIYHDTYGLRYYDSLSVIQ